MLKNDLPGYMEFKSFIPESTLNVPILDLVRFVDLSQIQTFGWPIAPVIHNPKFAPVPFGNGIKCIIKQDNGMFDYWTVNSEGNFYFLKSLFEDLRGGGRIYFDTRIIRTMESLWRTARLYKLMGANESDQVECEIEYGGLNDRVLGAANQMRIMGVQRVCHEPSFSQTVSSTVGELLSVNGLLENTHQFCSEFFQHFDFFELQKDHTDQIVKAYFNGKTA